MFETMRDELIYLEGAFRAIMMVKPMSDEETTVFQWALDSIDYIQKNQNWLDDKWVRVGFQNIEKAKALLFKMLENDDYPDDYYLGHARERLRDVEGIQPMDRSLLTDEVRKRLEKHKEIARKAIDAHNQQVTGNARASNNGIVGHGGVGGMRSLIRRPTVGKASGNEGGGRTIKTTYSSEELERLKTAFDVLRLRTCLTQEGKDVFTNAIAEIDKAMRGETYNSQRIKTAEDLREKVLAGNGHGRSLAPGLIKDEVPTRWNLGGHDRGGHDRGGHGGHGR